MKCDGKKVEYMENLSFWNNITESQQKELDDFIAGHVSYIVHKFYDLD